MDINNEGSRTEYTLELLGRFANLSNCNEMFSLTDLCRAAENREDRRFGKQQIDAGMPHGS